MYIFDHFFRVRSSSLTHSAQKASNKHKVQYPWTTKFNVPAWRTHIHPFFFQCLRIMDLLHCIFFFCCMRPKWPPKANNFPDGQMNFSLFFSSSHKNRVTVKNGQLRRLAHLVSIKILRQLGAKSKREFIKYVRHWGILPGRTHHVNKWGRIRYPG